MPVRRIKVSKGEVQSRKVEWPWKLPRENLENRLFEFNNFLCAVGMSLSNFLLQVQFNTFFSF